MNIEYRIQRFSEFILKKLKEYDKLYSLNYQIGNTLSPHVIEGIVALFVSYTVGQIMAGYYITSFLGVQSMMSLKISEKLKQYIPENVYNQVGDKIGDLFEYYFNVNDKIKEYIADDQLSTLDKINTITKYINLDLAKKIQYTTSPEEEYRNILNRYLSSFTSIELFNSIKESKILC